jgi:hypothetical protein
LGVHDIPGVPVGWLQNDASQLENVCPAQISLVAHDNAGQLLIFTREKSIQPSSSDQAYPERLLPSIFTLYCGPLKLIHPCQPPEFPAANASFMLNIRAQPLRLFPVTREALQFESGHPDASAALKLIQPMFSLQTYPVKSPFPSGMFNP